MWGWDDLRMDVARIVKACVAARLTLGGMSAHFFPREIHSPSMKEAVVDMIWFQN
jgi:hypothetical protein